MVGPGVYRIADGKDLWPEGAMLSANTLPVKVCAEESVSQDGSNRGGSGGDRKKLKLKESAQFGALRVTFDGLTIEESVRPDGGFAGAAVSAGLKVTAAGGGESQAKSWSTPYMTDYARVIKQEPGTVTMEFLNHRLRLVAADFDSNAPWLELEVQPTK